MNGSSTSEKLNLMHFYYTRLAKVLFALPLVLSTGYLNQEPCAPLVHPGSSQVCKVSAKVEEERVQTVDQLNRITFFYVSKIWKKIIVLETTCEEWLHAGHLSLKEQNRGKYYKEYWLWQFHANQQFAMSARKRERPIRNLTIDLCFLKQSQSEFKQNQCDKPLSRSGCVEFYGYKVLCLILKSTFEGEFAQT